MKQANLKYALVGSRGKLISSTGYKSATGFKLYLGNKLLAEYEYKGNPNAKEKRKFLDDIYFSVLDKFEAEKQKEIKRLKREEKRKNDFVLKEIIKIQKEEDKREREALIQIKLATNQLKFRNETEAVALRYPERDNQVYYLLADNSFKQTAEYNKAHYVLFFKNQALWPIVDSISINVTKRNKSSVSNFIDSFVGVVDTAIPSFTEPISVTPEKKIETDDEYEEYEEVTVKPLEEIKYNYVTEEKVVQSVKLGKRVVLHRKIVTFKEPLRIQKGESWKMYHAQMARAFLNIYDKAISETNGRRYENLMIFKIFTPYYDLTNTRVPFFTKMQTGEVYQVNSNNSIAYGFGRTRVNTRVFAKDFFEGVINTFDFAKENYLKLSGAYDTGISGFLIEFVLDK